jgi:RNA polymerase sigma-70 factor (ECF subfamily)
MDYLRYNRQVCGVVIVVAPEPDSRPITLLLQEWSRGQDSVLEELTPLVYQELHRLAEGYMCKEGRGHTLQPTALIHEAWLRLVRQGQPNWESRSQFFAFAAHLMRQILVDHARKKRTAKRAGAEKRVPLEESVAIEEHPGVDLILLDAALTRLAEFDQRRARVLELRFFGGLTEEEAARAIGISVATIRRDMRIAEAWLARELSGSP